MVVVCGAVGEFFGAASLATVVEGERNQGEGLTDDQLFQAASGDLDVLAVLMVVGSTLFALANWWLGTMGWIAVVLTIGSTLTWAVGLLRRSEVVAAFVKIGFGFSGLFSPVVALAGIVVVVAGYLWGWALLAGAVLYFGFSVLGLEIIARAEEAGVINEI